MAKAKKGPRQTVGLQCAICGSANYITEFNKNNEQLKKQQNDSTTFPINKYCKVCKKSTSHKLRKKLK